MAVAAGAQVASDEPTDIQAAESLQTLWEPCWIWDDLICAQPHMPSRSDLCQACVQAQLPRPDLGYLCIQAQLPHPDLGS